MRRLWWLGLVLAAGWLAGVAPASARSDPPAPCAAGTFNFESYEAALPISGNGANQPVTLTLPGNCFHVAFKGSANGLNWNEYQNGSGHCLIEEGRVLAVGSGACGGSGHPAEEVTALTSGPDGWTLGTEATIGLEQNSAGCNYGAQVEESSGLNCDHWNFP